MTDERIKEELKPCPFCGCEASDSGVVHYSRNREPHEWFADGTPVYDAYFCNCKSCGANNKGIIGYQTKREAVRAWNTRAAERLSKIDALESAKIKARECYFPQYVYELLDDMIAELKEAILSSPVKEGKTDDEKLAIAVKALEHASISIAKTDGDYDTLCVVRDALKEIQ